MLCLFVCKMFLKNIYDIFQCLVGAKIMVNENHFSFDHKSKSLFNFWKVIYGFKNRKLFFGFKLFINLARTFIGIKSVQLESGRIRLDFGQLGGHLAKQVGFQPCR
jgi:hypothetical protein